MQRVSPKLFTRIPLLSGTGFSVYLLTSNTESCDEDDEEVGDGVVEEARMVHSLIYCNQFSCFFVMRCGF